MHRLCDCTMFWSAAGGGVRRYLEQKIAWLGGFPDSFRHLLVVPGASDSSIEDGIARRSVVRCPSIPFSPGYRMPVAVGPVLRILSAWRPDLAEGGCPFRFRKALSAWAAASGRPVFDYYHAYFPVSYTASVFGSRTTPLRRALERAGWAYLRSVYSDSARIFVASPVVRDILSRHGVTNTELAPLGVDTALFRPRDGGAAPPVILFVGRLTGEKGLGTVVETYRAVAGRRPARLVIVGDGIMRREVEELAASDSGVSFLSFLEPGALAEVYRRSGVLLSAAPAETLGMTFLEALASGIPVVGLSGSGLMDTFPSAIARAVDDPSPERLAEAVLSFLDSPPDPEACRRHAESYSWPGRLAAILSRELEIAGLEVPAGIGDTP
ncbi:MAG TPA: glycosyltransferase [Candidatus Fermentibacter daniensis]|nr:glycosyltransferase [Candidatus Fermentibacter daniensis]